jgi:three-Cys-motif partner protein
MAGSTWFTKGAAVITQHELAPYEGREHAKAKHELLESYVQRYAMIIGQSAPSLAFVDCFSGPWKSATEDLSDTSFGLSLKALRKCAAALKARFSKTPRLRALWIEAADEPFAKLAEFARRNSTEEIEIEAVQGRFQEHIDQIVRFIGSTSYAFVFVDPKGYRGFIDPAVLAPLLKLPRAELLINYMWSHLRWALARSDEAGHADNMRRIYGDETDRLFQLDGAERERECLITYEKQLRTRSTGQGRARVRVLSYAILDTRGQQHAKYYLVHTTHAAKGLTTFAEECDQTNVKQNQIFQIAQLTRRDRQAGTSDMFADSLSLDQLVAAPATQPWLDRLTEPGKELKVDTETWADLLEAGRCLPSSLQQGLKELLDNGVLENCSAKKPRKTNHVNYEKQEVIRRLR